MQEESLVAKNRNRRGRSSFYGFIKSELTRRQDEPTVDLHWSFKIFLVQWHPLPSSLKWFPQFWTHTELSWRRNLPKPLWKSTSFQMSRPRDARAFSLYLVGVLMRLCPMFSVAIAQLTEETLQQPLGSCKSHMFIHIDWAGKLIGWADPSCHWPHWQRRWSIKKC